MIRSLLVTWVYLPLITWFTSVLVLFFLIFFKSSRAANKCVWFWAQSLCSLYGVRVVAKELHHIPPGGFLLLFNHSSFFDIFVISTLLPEVRFGAKAELFKIPFFGTAMKVAGVIPIDRGKREETVDVLKKNQGRIRQGARVGLSPEGGRFSHSETYLNSFKSGPFYFAIGSKAQILPCLIRGATSVWPKGSLLPAQNAWKTEIEVLFLKPFSTEGLELTDRHQLKDLVFQSMSESLKNWSSPL